VTTQTEIVVIRTRGREKGGGNPEEGRKTISIIRWERGDGEEAR
jgi:hypothetical protein